MSGSCCSGGKCCGNSGVNRRDFLKAAAASAGGLALLGGLSFADQQAALKAWTEDLSKPGERRVYRKDELENIAFPLGGVGAGQVYLTGRGQLDSWQIVNNFKTDAHAPGAMFGLWTRVGGQVKAKLLQEGERDGLPGVPAVEFSGEYPFAWVNYLDESLPVAVSMEAFTPLVPLEADESGLPLALFTFTLQNRSQQAVDAAILGTAPNLVGWDGYMTLDGNRCPNYVGNFNAIEERADATLLHMQTRPGTPPSLGDTLEFYTNDGGLASQMSFCGNVKTHMSRFTRKENETAPAVLWIRRYDGGSTQALQEGLDAAQQGAVVVLAGDASGLLALGTAGGASDERVVFEDWEKGSYEGWTVKGDCFGAAPATGTLPNQQAVSGWNGKSFVNTFVNGDDTTGKAVSKAFTIERNFIHIQVGGGKHPGETCVNLVVDGNVVHSATGENTEQLRPVRWDVADLKGKTATIEIVDGRKGGWGHVLVGDIVFSNASLSPFIDPALLERCHAALPLAWASGELINAELGVRKDSPLLAGLPEGEFKTRAHASFKDVQLKEGARVLLETAEGQPLVVRGPLGQGTLVVCNGPVHEWFGLAHSRTVAGNIISQTSGTTYTPQTGWAEDSIPFGSMALAVLPGADSVSVRPQWDDAKALWDEFARQGKVEAAGNGEPSAAGLTWNGALSAGVQLQPGEKRRVTFALAWHFPNRTRDHRYGFGPWSPEPFNYDFRLGNRYNNRFKSAAEVVEYYAKNAERLEGDTRQFHDTLYDTSLPRWLVDGVSANIASVRSPIFIWLEDGTFGGFEGTDACCPLNCTHVYNYAMTTAFLFPELERNVRELDLIVQMDPEGHYIPHRLVVPLSQPRMKNEIGGPHHHALDGELGALLKLYREWRFGGDNEWLKKIWPNTRKVMEHVLRDHDEDEDGVIRGEQPNTYDTHLFGSNTFIGTLYLASLRAVEEMAKAMGEDGFAAVCRERFQKGYDGYDKTCWNGEYYENIFDAPNAKPETYNENNCYGPGCFSDQLLGQWWAWLLDLGEVLPPEHIKTALGAIYKYNWRSTFVDHHHNQRVFAEGDEKGLLMGTWPKGGRPERPILYCDEVWTGIEYEVAALMIYQGMLDEGLQVAKAVRDRYTGDNRNPWAEIECGAHYARALSSWSLLNAAAGFDYDGATGRLGLTPRMTANAFQCFFTADRGWGTVNAHRNGASQRYGVALKGGSTRVSSLRVPANSGAAYARAEANVNGANVPCRIESYDGYCSIAFEQPLTLKAGEALSVELKQA
ncbi:MAG: GH116 family glycosyl hydrolase [FCB group bacterium]|jgi:uncharacterized protein (DUF608 family)|nr:GH116 family glycosyl hydrolase [FCB group bacterium]